MADGDTDTDQEEFGGMVGKIMLKSSVQMNLSP